MTGNVALWAYPIDGRESIEISTPNMGRGSMLVSTFPPGAYGPQPSAGNEELFFTAAAPRQHADPTGPRADIMKVNLQSGRTDSVSAQNAPTFKPQLSGDNKWLAYGAVNANTTGLRLRDMESGDDRWLVQDIGFNALESWASRDLLPGFAFTPDNDSLVIAYDGKIRRVNLHDGQVRNIPFNANVQIEVEPRATARAEINHGPVTARLAKGAVISPDGTQYAFSAFGRLYQIAIADQVPVKLTTKADFGEFHPAWSPDGNWLAYVTWSAAEGGAIWKLPTDGSGPAEKLTADNAYYRDPVWSADGDSIFAIRAPKDVRLENARGPLAQAEQIVRFASIGGEPVVVVSPAAGTTRVHFTEDGQRLYGYSPALGLSSWKLDGSDQTTILRVVGSATATAFPRHGQRYFVEPQR